MDVSKSESKEVKRMGDERPASVERRRRSPASGTGGTGDSGSPASSAATSTTGETSRGGAGAQQVLKPDDVEGAARRDEGEDGGGDGALRRAHVAVKPTTTGIGEEGDGRGDDEDSATKGRTRSNGQARAAKPEGKEKEETVRVDEDEGASRRAPDHVVDDVAARAGAVKRAAALGSGERFGVEGAHRRRADLERGTATTRGGGGDRAGYGGGMEARAVDGDGQVVVVGGAAAAVSVDGDELPAVTPRGAGETDLANSEEVFAGDQRALANGADRGE